MTRREAKRIAMDIDRKARECETEFGVLADVTAKIVASTTTTRRAYHARMARENAFRAMPRHPDPRAFKRGHHADDLRASCAQGVAAGLPPRLVRAAR